MKYYKNYIIFALSLLLFLSLGARVKGQTTTLTPSIEQIVPPSPNVSAINKFGNIPVGPSNGIPSVGIPIYTWNGSNFGKSVSVALNYHAGGVKVAEAASNVGLGWALNAGGVVSRTMRGLYDEMPIYGFLDATIPATTAEGNNYGGVPNNDRTFFKMNAGILDSQNDIFNYNFNGQSGRFVLGKGNRILFLEQTKIKVERFLSTINGKQMLSKFVITDEFGYSFVFEDYELTLSIGIQGLNSNYTSAWHLTRIIKPTGSGTIEFEYENYSIRNEYAGGSTSAVPLLGDGVGLPFITEGGSAQDVWGKRIKKINFPDGNQVDFYYSTTSRTDMPGDHLLQKIKMGKDGAVFGYLLGHDYSISGRATLKSVTPIGGPTEIQDVPYTFEYDMGYALPGRFSTSVDHWGYANLNSGGFLPHEFVRAPGGAFNPFREFSGGNRNSDPLRMKAGSMTKMSYPTGGYTLFEMEANTAKDNWLEQNDTVTVTNPPYTDRSMNEGISSDNYPAASIPFSFGGENSTITNFDVKINPLGGTCGGSCAILFELYTSANAFVTSQQVNFTDPSPDPYSITKSFSVSGLIKGQNYYFKVYTIDLSGYYEYVEIKWREINVGGSTQIVLSNVQPFVGGLRAKKISDYTQNATAPAKVREYEYVKEDGLTSSGALGFRPVYTSLVRYQHIAPPELFQEPFYYGNFDYNYALRNSNTVNEITYANGSPVTYGRVVEKVTDNGASVGKTVRYFTNFKDSPPILQDVFPIVPTQFTSWSYGLLTKEEVYGTGDQLLKKTENFYEHHADRYADTIAAVEAFRSISIAPVVFMWNGPVGSPHIDPSSTPHYFIMSNFTPVAGRSDLVQSKVTEYTATQPDLVTINYSEYDQQNYYLKQTTLINSNGEERKLKYLYPRDRIALGDNPALYTAMLGKNMLRNSVGQQELLGGSLLAEQRIDYLNWGANLFAPKHVKTQASGYPLETRINYQDYDQYGAVVSVKQEDGVPISYVWGYGGEHLVAKITNASYAEVTAAMGGTAGVESFRNTKNPTDLSVQQLVDGLRTTLVNAFVEGFSYNTLIGLTSQTDIKGLRTYYEYDPFGRLMNLKDQDGNIVKHYHYNYKQ